MIRLGLLRKSNEALSEGIPLSKSNSSSGIVVVIGGGGRVGQVLGSIVVLSIDSNSASSASDSYIGLIITRKTK